MKRTLKAGDTVVITGKVEHIDGYGDGIVVIRCEPGVADHGLHTLAIKVPDGVCRKGSIAQLAAAGQRGKKGKRVAKAPS